MKIKPLPSLSILKSRLDYNSKNGVFTRKPHISLGSQKSKAGKQAGFVYTRSDGKRSDIRIKINSTSYLAHRLAWMIQTGVDPLGNEIDHINGDSTDNRFCNLRIVDRTVNCRNAKKRADNKSGITGVSFDNKKQRWITQTGTDNGRVCRSFNNLFDACCFRLSLLNKATYSKRHGL